MARQAITGNGYHHEKMERRRSLRISAPFPVRVRGISSTGRRLEFYTELENLGAGGLFLNVTQDIRDWKRLRMILWLSLTGNPETPAPVVAARAEVLRIEAQPDQRLGFAVAFTRHRFV